MTQELVVPETRTVRLETDQIKYIAATEFALNYKGNLPAAMACVAAGRELGIGDMEALRDIVMVNGRPTFSAELMVRQARRYGHSIQGEATAEKATARGKRADNGDEMTVEWTLEMAKRAGLVGKDNWKKYPESMLWARAVSQLCRMLFSDSLAGVSYTPEEVEMTDEDRVIEATSVTIPDVPAPDDGSASDEGAVTVAPHEAAPPDADTEQGAFVIPEKARRQETGE